MNEWVNEYSASTLLTSLLLAIVQMSGKGGRYEW